MDNLGGIPYACAACCNGVPKLENAFICNDCGAVCCAENCLCDHECDMEGDWEDW